MKILIITILVLFPIKLEAKSCFETCMATETIPAICLNKCSTAKKNDTIKQRIFKEQKNRAEYIQRLQEVERAKYREKQQNKIKKKRLDKLIAEKRELSKEMNLGCYSACMLKKDQDRYCENLCVDKKPSQLNKIDTGDSAIDQMIIDCYKGCFMKTKLSPACLHSCCYICAKQKFNESTGHFEDSRSDLSLDCLDKCISNGTDKMLCENICSGYYSTTK